MKIPILRGVYADTVADFVESYPINREPVVLNTGLSEGYLRPAPGITALGSGTGADRGGINWGGTCYRVIGSKLVTVSATGVITDLGTIADSGPCAFDYSFDRLAINGGTRLYYWNGAALTQVTDPDLGSVLDMIWIDGYFMTTDGESIVVTQLNDPTSVDPLKYGSSESDPDPVKGLIKLGGEAYVLNRHTIQVFSNIGGNGFPFAEIEGARISYGCVGSRAKTLFAQTFAFVGSGRNEQPGVYLAGSGQAAKISTGRIDKLLAALSEAELAAITLEARVYDDEQRLLVNLPDKTLVFYYEASRASEAKVWTVLASGVFANEAYRGQGGVWAYGKWIVGDADGNIGVIDPFVPTHFGAIAAWQFDTAVMFNETGRGILRSAEIVGLPGRAVLGADPRAFMSSTIDGVLWSQEQAISTGRAGDRARRMQWRPKRRFNRWIGLRFRGADAGMASFARLDADIEALGS